MKKSKKIWISLPSTPSFGIRFALVISFFLAVIKGLIGITSGSLAILGSALDSFMDMFVSGINALALKLSEHEKTKKFSYGFGKIQGFAAIFEGCIVLITGIFLGYSGVMNFIEKKVPVIMTLEITTMIVAIIGTGIIMWNFIRISKIHDSLLIRSDALHYSSDLLMNGGILIAILLTKYFSLWWADAVFAIGISFWIIKNAFPIIWGGISMLLDQSLQEDEVDEIGSIIESEDALEGFHYLKTRRSGDDIFIEAHIVFRDKNISLQKAHSISESLESILSARFVGATITLHLDVDPEPESCEIPRK